MNIVISAQYPYPFTYVATTLLPSATQRVFYFIIVLAGIQMMIIPPQYCPKISSPSGELQVLATQLSDSWFNGVIIESLIHVLTVMQGCIRHCSPSYCGSEVVLRQAGFITNGEMEEARFSALTDSLVPDGPLWVSTISSIVASINILIADCVITHSDIGIRFGGVGSFGKGAGGLSSFLPYAHYVEHCRFLST
ncbi:hypothetical protein EDD18DRAFT_1109476 [Armillaria luteobubalina]|uniref:Uncharacterized protein n=1 Tax=Armillaria luteobubalina TaxID=153913 RepID=A0AA39PW93_9AGAR|nr:hypothetical protein EDD18DRAFT_1109476 [Armillaria luteobubalina]